MLCAKRLLKFIHRHFEDPSQLKNHRVDYSSIYFLMAALRLPVPYLVGELRDAAQLPSLSNAVSNTPNNMSWFGGADPVAELDSKIAEATSESIPNGELDVAIALEITDDIRSKKVQPKQAVRCLKKRLTKVYTNPNLLSSTLKLCDMCVKNGGSHFLAELDSKEFLDYLVEVIFKVHYDNKSYKVYSSEAKMQVGRHILVLVQEWAAYFKNSGKLSYLGRVFTNLQNQGYEFPPLDPLINEVAANFVDSKGPPDWMDGKECMICYTPFSVMNRQHHCRACGGVFCQSHSSQSIPLVSLGILLPVRVCDDCYQIHKNASLTRKRANPPKRATSPTKSTPNNADEDEELKRAIELSLKETTIQTSFVPPAQQPAAQHSTDEEMDEDLKAAIKASLEDCKEAPRNMYQDNNPPSQPQKPELEFYLNIMPFNVNAYSKVQPAQSFSAYDRSAPLLPLYQAPRAPEQPPPLQTAPSVQAAPLLQEQLTEQDEGNVNLFVQLMYGIENDRFKQANILNDQNLNDLHGKVVRLKPKLNRSLRDAIEKYEYFLEMNNKISSITRLYDQYLENMLNNAYNRHSISLPSNFYSSPYPASHEPAIQQPVLTGGSSNGRAKDLGYFGAQGMGPFGPPKSIERPTLFYDSQDRAPQNSEQLFRPQKELAAEPVKLPPYVVADINSSDIQVSSYNRKRSDSMYPVDSDVYPTIPNPTYRTGGKTLSPQCVGTYPQEPSSPPDDSDVEDTESVSSRFPPLEQQYGSPTQEDLPNRKHASMRFPSLNRIEQVSTSRLEESKFQMEPEPLIEL